jgi:radical SAM protein with 4Fe4S-binding SPASM domain
MTTDEFRQPPPFCLQVELTEGCQLRCDFCGLNGIRGRENNFKFMSVELALRLTRLMKDDCWLPRIEFAMHGEPSANPDMLAILNVVRYHLPRRAHLMMTSNGYGFVKDPTTTVDAALHCLNVLALDAYEGVRLVPRILEQYRGRHEPSHYPADARANPHRRRTQGEYSFVIVQDISRASKGTHSTLNNHAGSGAPPNDHAAGKRCAKPFREISIRWDGGVAICCNDWSGRYVVGNVWDMTLEELWHSPAMRAARRKLYRGQRDFGPCKGCDALSYRPGLLPDQRGKAALPPPDEDDEAAIGAALAAGPLTAPVRRPWELPVLGEGCGGA